MTQRPERQPEDIDSPLHPAADPDLEDGTEVPQRRSRTDVDEDKSTPDEPGSDSD
jgi:hypothetical protein